MRALWIIVLVAVAVLGVTSVASAAMRDEMAALVDTAVSLATDDGDFEEELPLPPGDGDDGTDEDGDDGTGEDGDEGDVPDGDDDGTVDDGDEAVDDGDEADDEDGAGAQNGNTWRWRVGDYRNHGEAVSAVATCKDDTGQNHGAAVSAVAKSDAGKKVKKDK